MWDREDNATANILKLTREQVRDALGTGTARNDENGKEIKEIEETRWQRARRLAAEKQARQESAREAEAKSA